MDKTNKSCVHHLEMTMFLASQTIQCLMLTLHCWLIYKTKHAEVSIVLKYFALSESLPVASI